MADRKPAKGHKPLPDLDLALGEPPSGDSAWSTAQSEGSIEDDETLDVNFEIEIEEPPELPGSGPAASGYHSLRDELSHSAPPEPPPPATAPHEAAGAPGELKRSRAPRSIPPGAPRSIPPGAPRSIPPGAPRSIPRGPARSDARASSRILEPHGPNAATLPNEAPLRRSSRIRPTPRKPRTPMIVAVSVIATSLGLVLGGGALGLGWWLLSPTETSERSSEIVPQVVPTEIEEPAPPPEPEQLPKGIPIERSLRNSNGKPRPPPRPTPPPSE